MSIVWLLERPTGVSTRLSSNIQGSFPVRLIASYNSLLSLQRLKGRREVPSIVLVNSQDYSDEIGLLVENNFRKSWVVHFKGSTKAVHGRTCLDENHLPFLIDELLSNNLPVQKDLNIDFESMTLFLEAESLSIPLSHKEAKILKVLMEADSAAISRDDLILGVWDGGKISRSTLDSQISRLRKKLDPTKVVIENVYGGGYRLIHTPR